jgi:hypothetical protein
MPAGNNHHGKSELLVEVLAFVIGVGVQDVFETEINAGLYWSVGV